MPPVPLQRRPLSFEDPLLSDDDVGLLYQVITRAERDPEVERLPYRVLFNAYDQVIAEHGVDADPGYACMRFLLKMGSKDIAGESLFEKFESLLERMGIVIEIGDDDGQEDTYVDTVPSVESRVRKRRHDATGESTEPTYSEMQTPLRRRASFNSMYDVGDDPTQRSFINRPSSRSSMSRLQIGKPEYPFPDSTPHTKRAITSKGGTDSPDRTQLIAQFLDVGRRLMNRFDLLAAAQSESAPEEKPMPNGLYARAAVDRDRSERIAEASRSQPSKSSNSSDDGEDQYSSSQDEASGSFGRPEAPPELLYRPSLSDLLRDASTFNMYRQRAIHRRILTQWLKKAVERRQTHQHMEVVASNRDRGTLLRQAFETWHGKILEKRRAERTERFFNHLEERAGRARDLYLLTKAFSHWAQFTSEEVARTSAARRHILGVKYFNAWREITAVNELKAQRFALRRPFNAWRKRTRQLKQAEAAATAMHDEKLTNAAYWQWFWHFCEQRAPQWYDHCLKRRSLLYWLRKFRTNREQIHDIEVRSRYNLLTSAWQSWRHRTEDVNVIEEEASLIQRRQLLGETFREWKAQTHLAPVAAHISHMVDNRILRSTYQQWIHRVQMLQQAREMDRHRIVRNAWTAWNDLLRCQALHARIDERLKLEAMYKWILAERFRLMQRIREQRIKHETFFKFVTNVRGTYSVLLDRAEAYERRQTKDLLRSKLLCWRNQLAVQHERDNIAFEFYAPRLAQESLVAWRSKLQHVTKIEEWAQKARFYFLATKYTKQWRAAATESAKRRRQEAYIKTRRKHKIKLATDALLHWLSKARTVADLEHQAIQFSRQKVLVTAAELLGRWQDRTITRIQECGYADNHYARQNVQEQLTRWADNLAEVRRQEEQANAIHHLHALSQASSQLRKLSFRIFQVRRFSEMADAMKDRNLRKHTRGMFRNWLDQARAKLEARDTAGPLLSPRRNLDAPLGLDTNRRLFDPYYQVETPFKTYVTEPQATSTTPLATPNFLTSPTKRAAPPVAQGSTTPATPLYTPFASRLLRAGALPRTLSSRRRAGQGSALGTSVRFVDEEPESPTDGRRSSGRRT
ncbi:Sfi1 family protein [Aspergillus brunneoviolaceus CBS 621.78]|uniref:Sfi1-domain-containing protein n=1 Tax=Aspergillus brunneoviolaceus CBS 621.78 TaxID=1450534 RepID=A0ACD1G6D3_9EURO|nr:Sfi1-domain-containing protein [Aspergillus brunneoviolaceus CBS 621.78]RAH44795.1 Sfi1-domain-containing protein [Aspergillus brunneoviolaceus CBS 621.78]